MSILKKFFMENVVDLIATDSPASEISDRIKEILYARSGEKIDSIRPSVAATLFDQEESQEEE